MTRVLHVSDLHFGTREEPDLERAVTALLERRRPGARDRERRPDAPRPARPARAGGPLPAVSSARRCSRSRATTTSRTRSRPASRGPWREFERLLGDDRADLQLGRALRRRPELGAAVAPPERRAPPGAPRRACETLGTPRRERVQDRRRFTTTCSAHPGARRRSPSPSATACSRRSSTAGAELILAGHIHQAAVSERREFEVTEGDVRAVVVSIAPGLGQPRPHRRGEARGLHRLRDRRELADRVHTYIWRADDWGLTAVRGFPRGREPLAVDPVT